VYRSILVPLDGSLLTERALPYAEHLARASGARLLLVRAALAHSLPCTGPLQTEAQAVRVAERHPKEAAARLSMAGVAETAMFYGDAAEAILEEIRLRKIDLVVMATHGCSGLWRWLFASVAEQVLLSRSMPWPAIRDSPSEGTIARLGNSDRASLPAQSLA
jgi:nucleotide-binding universal stress UspA family protein